jgi:hypothetical protein
MSDTMSGAELKVHLTGLGLTPAWLAHQLGVTTRTVIRWCGLDEVPDRAAVEVEKVTAITSAEMNRLYQAMQADGVMHTQYADQDAGTVQRLNTLPASWHRALTFRVLQYVRKNGSDASVSYVRPA